MLHNTCFVCDFILLLLFFLGYKPNEKKIKTKKNQNRGSNMDLHFMNLCGIQKKSLFPHAYKIILITYLKPLNVNRIHHNLP